MDMPIKKSGPRIAQLDGWRGISILFVVVGHLVNRRYSVPAIDSPSVAGVLSIWGVNIFFVISGFIITKLALREYDGNGRFSIRNFYARRFFRIIPPVLVYLGSVALAASYSLIAQPHSETLMAAAFVCNFPNAHCGGFAEHTWTLAYEEQFYIVFPLLFASIGRHARRFFGALFILLVAFPFLRFLLHFGDGWRAVANFAPSFSFICAGAVTAAYEDNIKRLSGKRHAFYISCGVALLLFGLLMLNATFSFPPGSRLAYMQVSLNNVILPICIAWLVGSSVHQSNCFTMLITTPPLLFLGTISYSLYLWQQMFTVSPALYISDSLLLISPIMFVVATLSYYVVERPSIQLGKWLLTCAAGGASVPAKAEIDVQAQSSRP